MMFTLDEQLAIIKKVESVLGKEIGGLLGNPHLHVIKELVDKLEGKTDGNEPTAPITASNAIASTTAATTTIGDGSQPTDTGFATTAG